MKRTYGIMLAALALCMPLAACDLGGTVNGPGTVANSTVLDEQIGIGTEAAYTAASTLGTALAKAGVIDTAKFKALDNQAYSALLAVRAAYKAGNADSYATAAAQVYEAVARIKSLVK
jgi:predicted small secreted protein